MILNCAVRYIILILLVCHCKYSSVLYHFRDKARYWLTIAIVFIPPAFEAPVKGSPSEYCHTVCVEKLKWSSYLTAKKFEDMFSHSSGV